jgi:hypothetical protein
MQIKRFEVRIHQDKINTVCSVYAENEKDAKAQALNMICHGDYAIGPQIIVKEETTIETKRKEKGCQ